MTDTPTKTSVPKMVHLRVDIEYYTMDPLFRTMGTRQMACGMRQLADGHAWVEDRLTSCLHVTCPLCLPECQQLGTPISQISGRPGTDSYGKFIAIAESWGYP